MTSPELESDGFEGLNALAAHIKDCAASGVERHAVLLRSDLLPARLSRAHHHRLARAALDPLSAADRARRIDLPDGRLAVSWRGDAAPLLQEALTSLRHLLQDAPDDAPLLSDLLRPFELPRDGSALLDLAGWGAVRKTVKAERALPPPVRPLPQPVDPLDAAGLATLERQLVTADMSRFARRRAVCRLEGDRAVLAWDRRVLSAEELGADLAPTLNVKADAWLFRRLTRMLDRRMLALLASPGELDGAGPFSVGLNVGSVLSPEFLRFDAALPPGLRGGVVLEMLPADIMADPVAFAFARDFAHARSYRLLLRDVSATLLPALRLDQFGMDIVQLRWSPALQGMTLPAGVANWLLGGADDLPAMRWGRGQDICLYEGNAVLRR